MQEDMKELGEALKLIFSKIADFFDIFDLSFFVSGIASASSVALYEYLDTSREIDRGIWRLYVRLWAEIRHSDSVTPSLQLLKRYWVMAATYDGIAISMALWALLLFAGSFGWGIASFLNWKFGIPFAIILLLFGAACLREGRQVS